MAYEVTFDSALTNETNWTYSDKVYYHYKDGFEKDIYFKSEGAYVASPSFERYIVSLHLDGYYTNATNANRRQVIIRPASGFSGVDEQSLIREVRLYDPDRNVFDFEWSEADGVTSFEIVAGKGRGNFMLRSCEIVFADIPFPPKGPFISSTWSNIVRVGWQNRNTTYSTRLVWRRVYDFDESWDDIAAYDFSDLDWTENATSNITAEVAERWPGLSGENINIYKGTSGKIQVGSRTAMGALEIAPPDYSAEILFIEAAKYPSNSYGKNVPVYAVGGGVTNTLVDLSLTTNMTRYAVALDALSPDSIISISSATNHANAKTPYSSIYIRSLRFIKNYTAPYTFPEWEREKLVSGKESAYLELDGPGEYEWACAAVTPKQGASPLSRWMRFTVPEGMPSHIWPLVIKIR